MIDKLTEERAALFVLDLLEAEELKAFEGELAHSPELQQFVRELKSGLYEPVRTQTSPARPDLLDKIIDQVDPEADPVVTPMPQPSGRSFSLPWGWIFGAAAVILLGLNFILLTLLRQQSTHFQAREAGEIAESSVVDAAVEEASPSNEPALLEARIERLEDDLEDKVDQLADLRAEREDLMAEVAEVQAFNSGWQREYARLAARLLPFYEPNDGMSRFTVIEMVDADAFTRNLPRRGFADLAGRFLSGEGNIAGTGSESVFGPVVEGAGVQSATLDPDGIGLNPLAQPMSEGGEVAQTDQGDAITPIDGEPGRPTGFSVWNDNEQKGFLDLYNIPEAGTGSEAYLWVRSSDLDPYLPVGPLPELSDGTGSIFYSVEESNFTPSEILITEEPVGEAGDEPSGGVILRGP